jgi:nucleoside-diphosphate-sugar epimerase
MRVLVTGAAGFLGSHIVEQLLSAGHQVRALVRSDDHRLKFVDVKRGDVLDRPSLDAAVAGCDAVIHTAAMLSFRRNDARAQREVNVQGTRNVLEAARAAGVKRFVHTSSIAAIGRPRRGGVADEETRYDWPVGFTYNETKRDAEDIVRSVRDLETVCLNPAFVVGPNERYRRTLPLFFLAKHNLLPLAPPGGTTLTDVREAAAAHVAALTSGKPGARYVLGGPLLSFVELLGELARVTGGRAPLGVLPERLIHAGALPLILVEKLGVALPYMAIYYPYLTTSTFYSSERSIAELGYRVRPASETLGDAAAWYRREGAL